MFSRFADWADHIIDNVDRVVEHMEGMTAEQVRDDRKSSDAIERCLERISEAVYRFHRAGVDLALYEPDIRWVDIRVFGNRLRHEYDAVAPDLIEAILTTNLTDLRQAASRLRDRFEAEP